MVVDQTNIIEYNKISLLKTIESSNQLNDIFRNEDEISTSYNLLYMMAKQDILPENINSKLKEIFDEIIMKYSEYRKQYLKHLINTDNKIIEVPVEVPLPIKNDKSTKLPKHYGKKRIAEEIEKSGTKTELDRTMLALNDLRNLFARLKNRCIKDKLTDVKTLTNLNYREITAAIRMLENKLNPILKNNFFIN